VQQNLLMDFKNTYYSALYGYNIAIFILFHMARTNPYNFQTHEYWVRIWKEQRLLDWSSWMIYWNSVIWAMSVIPLASSKYFPLQGLDIMRVFIYLWGILSHNPLVCIPFLSDSYPVNMAAVHFFNEMSTTYSCHAWSCMKMVWDVV
jgi:hypothetical protein